MEICYYNLGCRIYIEWLQTHWIINYLPNFAHNGILFYLEIFVFRNCLSHSSLVNLSRYIERRDSSFLRSYAYCSVRLSGSSEIEIEIREDFHFTLDAFLSRDPCAVAIRSYRRSAEISPIVICDCDKGLSSSSYFWKRRTILEIEISGWYMSPILARKELYILCFSSLRFPVTFADTKNIAKRI